ncbi:hypothetical protein NWP22_13615 [Anabaenopsis tanganyikae CS-531]|uniref:HD Cas3-type domain-containing protein n=1 Tax=Anabaenopsis tanganyikae CS-531 TaxID=2785304 RepID=A0ABT6KG76_9CYAN|nr:hypothetical protein [Anabaenopsis tanganyikae]MDH6106890.1 hypothetical protein [Anabaenopsis tanganyikae CS-531]
MTNYLWQPSDEQRRTILFMEVAGIIHDLGKLSNGFIKESAQDKPRELSYNYQSIAEDSYIKPFSVS